MSFPQPKFRREKREKREDFESQNLKNSSLNQMKSNPKI